MAHRLLPALASLLVVLPLVPAAQGAAATQVFHLAPDNDMTLLPVAALDEPVSSGVGSCVVVCVRHESETAWHAKDLRNGGTVAPVRSTFWVEARDTTVVSPVSFPDVDGCPMNVYLIVVASDNTVKGGWSFCVGFDGATFDGLQEVDLDWSWADAVVAAPGDFLRVSIWTTASSSALPEHQTLYLVSDPTHQSTLEVSGTSEPVPAAADKEPDQEPATQNATAPPPVQSTTTTSRAPTSTTTSRPTTTTSTSAPPSEEPQPEPETKAPAKASPAAGLLLAVGLVAGAAAMRRRLA